MYNSKKLEIALDLHEKWINCEPTGIKIDLVGADLSGADLKGANLRLADLRGANLKGANLKGANLRLADLGGADLSGADLSGADLYRADLHDADLYIASLKGADLRSADLSGADLSGADLHDADLRWANTINIKGLYIISVMDIMYYPILKKATAGTFSGALDELKAVIEKQYDQVTVKRYKIAFKAIEDLLETY